MNEPLEFHLNNFANNKILWKKSKIRKLLYTLREEAYPKDSVFLSNINLIKIQLSDDINSEQNFCLCKGEFINFKKEKIEKFVIFSSEFQINLFTEIDELFLDSTFKICPPNWYQLLNFFGFIKKRFLCTFRFCAYVIKR